LTGSVYDTLTSEISHSEAVSFKENTGCTLREWGLVAQQHYDLKLTNVGKGCSAHCQRDIIPKPYSFRTLCWFRKYELPHSSTIPTTAFALQNT
jgi:hypothetical protein